MEHTRFTELFGSAFVELSPTRLCADCRIEQIFTNRICHAPTSMLPLDIIQAAGMCERCGGAIVCDNRSDAKQRNTVSAARDGTHCARGGESLPDFWELVDLGYSLPEAAAYHRAYRREAGR